MEPSNPNEWFSHALFKPNDHSLIVVISDPGMYMQNSYLHTILTDNLPDFGKVNSRDYCSVNLGRLPDADADLQIDSLALSKDGREFVVTSCVSKGSMDGDWLSCCPEYISIYGSPFVECCFDDPGCYCPYKHIKNVATFSPDGKQILVSANNEGCLYFLDRTSASLIETQYRDGNNSRWFDTALGLVFSLDWAPTNNLFAAGNDNGEAAIWNVNNTNPIWQEKVFTSNVEHLLFSSDGASLALLSKEGDLMVMNVGEEILGLTRDGQLN